jgi:hypothetical protein
MADDRLHVFGIRHHGPGSASALLRALDALRPETVLVEGPPEADALIPFVTRGLRPPVALLVHPADAPDRAVFHPFAEWSPEWVALRWAARAGRAVRFIDLPRRYREAPSEAPATPPAERDPFAELAALDGYDDGEAWWNALVEEGSNPPETLFSAIEDAVRALRGAAEEEAGDGPAREAHMRREIRDALAHGAGPVAAVVGAWHAPAVRPEVSTKRQDRALLGPRKKTKMVATWIPWSDGRLAAGSGYGAGVRAPGWYRKLWALEQGDASAELPSDPGELPPPRSPSPGSTRSAPAADLAAPGPGSARALATSWQVDVARALRREGHDAAPATVIDAVRLSEVLTAMRGRARPGLSELCDASLATFCGGERARWSVVERALLVGDRIGSIPDDVPQMPLAADLARAQRRLRLPPEETPRELALDLRSDTGRGRSVLLHRLRLLDVPWGTLLERGRSRGTFREKWRLAWEVEHAVRLAEALPYGPTLATAAESRVRERLRATDDLAELAGTVRDALPAELPEIVQVGAERLQAASVAAADVEGIARAVPPLVDIDRYGTARELPLEALRPLVGRLMEKVHVGLHHAARHLNEESATALHGSLAAYDRAVFVFEEGSHREGWTRALARTADDPQAAPRIRGFAVRRARDTGVWPEDRVRAELASVLSPGTPLQDAAGWLEGFLGEAGQLILGDQALFELIDGWLTGLEEDALREALPLFRRASANFSPADRRKVLDMAAGRRVEGHAVAAEDDAVFVEGAPLLDLILGLPRP